MADETLVCFTNCHLALDDGSQVKRDLWVDSTKGIILNAQEAFYTTKKRPGKIVDLGGNILSPGFIDIQINGAYGFDFSIHADDESYVAGLKMVADRIVETGVTSLLPTIITQKRALYPKLLPLLSQRSFPGAATLLGWHSEGPFLQLAKRGAHAEPLLATAPDGIRSFEDVYGAENLAKGVEGVRMITAAPELDGVMNSISELSERGVIFSIGHSVASSKIATEAILNGARMITHLFNAMPQLHHRDPAIIGLLGAGGPYSTRAVPSASKTGHATLAAITPLSLDPSLTFKPAFGVPTPPYVGHPPKAPSISSQKVSEALNEMVTPPQTPDGASPSLSPIGKERKGLKGMTLAELDEFERPFYGIIVDGIHSHPNSVRLAYTAHPEGCILVTDAMSFLDPHLPDGHHDWRDGRRVVKHGDKLFIEGTDTLAGSVVTLDTCVRNFSLFTSRPLSYAIKCATYNPAKCLGIESTKGTLRPGADADLVVLDKNDGSVLSTWVAGKKVWNR
ncbi:Metallo-dependent hydrolase [Cantharellus anzutake]|uniref:Metallo-dependent hydrolase n=1 Tax=Cantharellus anzutake TaxID=1750568 RepID=UPI00190357B7|nr:Metallo-dependent hydrolase [Cantharellus anzutake]KAF8342708.1 Metallo-dependent hydrolase [Cantharellus anzutake]